MQIKIHLTKIKGRTQIVEHVGLPVGTEERRGGSLFFLGPDVGWGCGLSVP